MSTSARPSPRLCWATPTAVEYRYASGNDRFTLVKLRRIDVLFRNSTWTATRDSAEVGMEFMPVNFYDGQGMMVRKDSGITSLEDMDGATVCVQSGTTTELNLADVFRTMGSGFHAGGLRGQRQDLWRLRRRALRRLHHRQVRSGCHADQAARSPDDHMILEETPCPRSRWLAPSSG
jgi:hypothetical protein